MGKIVISSDTWYIRVYRWYYYGHIPPQDNLCHFVRVVLLWAPLRWFLVGATGWKRPITILQVVLPGIAIVALMTSGIIISDQWPTIAGIYIWSSVGSVMGSYIAGERSEYISAAIAGPIIAFPIAVVAALWRAAEILLDRLPQSIEDIFSKLSKWWFLLTEKWGNMPALYCYISIVASIIMLLVMITLIDSYIVISILIIAISLSIVAVVIVATFVCISALMAITEAGYGKVMSRIRPASNNPVHRNPSIVKLGLEYLRAQKKAVCPLIEFES